MAKAIIAFPYVKGDAVPALGTSVEGNVRQKQDVKDFNVCSGSPPNQIKMTSPPKAARPPGRRGPDRSGAEPRGRAVFP